jgi:predicted O-methyltransferase YrrM
MKTFEETLETLAKLKEYSTDKNTTHSYLELYDQLFAPYKTKPINLLEIGNNGGGSIELWNDYFEDIQINGLEINDLECLHKLNNDHPNIEIKMGVDAYTASTLNMFTDKSFDIIMDDGSHQPTHQIYVLNEWMKKLRSGGLMIIEDIQDISLVHQLLNNVTLKCEDRVKIYDRRHIKQQFDDITIVINKG